MERGGGKGKRKKKREGKGEWGWEGGKKEEKGKREREREREREKKKKRLGLKGWEQVDYVCFLQQQFRGEHQILLSRKRGLEGERKWRGGERGGYLFEWVSEHGGANIESILWEENQ